ncbi:ATP-grasp domain-containing protein [Chitinophaga sp. GCM10012297]|uniref:ATP-grasp domain-containing protein n=1 Tax=Chitinophaga chungangae TaxID=2821488 RepID=A0ABS3YF02_9BACT|nr:ATP-grasp domain-containing protein [Chitinophaga chungangae]MBO9153257.1 ATP-grasp domain-containing protein [Chitinophaga chungangae]
MDKKRVLVTGIGGNVGQGIIRNILKCNYDVEITGTNISSFSAGNHLCDRFHEVPYAYDPAFLPAIRAIVEQEGIDLVIPSTDYEVYYLSANSASIGAKVAASGPVAAELYLDKFLSYQHHSRHNIPFAASLLPSAYQSEFDGIIVKPRKGRGSRGLHINPSDLTPYSDEEYMVQRFARGKEITTAFYVTREGKLHGAITLMRSLENGATSQCRVVFDYDDALVPILQKMIAHADIRGAANLQSIVTEEGEIVPFEVNCRISGTNSIRSNFGFEDVKYTLQEYLYNTSPDKPAIKPGVAVRILMDVIYPDVTDFDQCKDNSAGFHIF